MKLHCHLISTIALLGAFSARSQGTFLYDQQSSPTDSYQGGAFAPIQQNQPFGQSFTPALPTVGFIRLYVEDALPGDPTAGVLHVNLRAGSITGTIIASTDPLTLPSGFLGAADFIFTTPVSVTPGTTYYLQPEAQNGDLWGAAALQDVYAGGTIYGLGTANPNEDLWFREGVMVPEPSALGLMIVGMALALIRRKRRC